MMPDPNKDEHLYLVHWNETEAQELAATLQEKGWIVTIHHSSSQFKMGELSRNPPKAVLISLRRLPSHGREIADALWSSKWGKEIPIIFFDGKPENLDALREKFAEAVFTTWSDLFTILSER
jgi:DNA-binding response OmpR family regulator